MKDEPDRIDMFHDAPQVAQLYTNWLYTGRLNVALHCRSTNDSWERTAVEAEKVFVVLAQAYVFGAKVLDTTYQNVVVKMFHEAKTAAGFNPGSECVSIVFDAVSAGNPLRRFIADCIARDAFDNGNGVEWCTYIEQYPQEALAEAMKSMISIRAKPDSAKRPYDKDMKAYLEKEDY
jgi:hypothetical protein